jgi:hypothetical protein
MNKKPLHKKQREFLEWYLIIMPASLFKQDIKRTLLDGYVTYHDKDAFNTILEINQDDFKKYKNL